MGQGLEHAVQVAIGTKFRFARYSFQYTVLENNRSILESVRQPALLFRDRIERGRKCRYCLLNEKLGKTAKRVSQDTGEAMTRLSSIRPTICDGAGFAHSGRFRRVPLDDHSRYDSDRSSLIRQCATQQLAAFFSGVAAAPASRWAEGVTTIACCCDKSDRWCQKFLGYLREFSQSAGAS